MMQQQQAPASSQPAFASTACARPLHPLLALASDRDSTPHVHRLQRRVQWPPVSKAVAARKTMRFLHRLTALFLPPSHCKAIDIDGESRVSSVSTPLDCLVSSLAVGVSQMHCSNVTVHAGHWA